MKEWEISENITIKDSENCLNNSLVVMSNLIARSSTKFTLEETKIFLCMLSQISTKDKNNWVTISKNEIAEKLNIDPTNRTKLRTTVKRMASKSWIEFDDNKSESWIDGFLINAAKADKTNLSVRFNDIYLPLLEKLSEHFTKFYLQSVLDFKSMASYRLYVYLCSWYDENWLIQNKKIKKTELYKVFGLKKDSYWRNYGTSDAKFDFAKFEQKVWNFAIDEINALYKQGKCDLRIEHWEKIKMGKIIQGYDISYSFYRKNETKKMKKLGHDDGQELNPYIMNPKQFLEKLQNGKPIGTNDTKIINYLKHKMKFSDEVINIMLEYILKRSENKLRKTFVQMVAGEWARDGVKTKEDAIKATKKETTGKSAYMYVMNMPEYMNKIDESKMTEEVVDEDALLEVEKLLKQMKVE